ncbi:MAG: tRNA guanosine(34) transglycosylase Tgt [Candidatus Berkelbacteria bacterium]|nr:tRNA guanosine(34) transglycosylase Tgt [Candidatus Berkelbacteria bacterium]
MYKFIKKLDNGIRIGELETAHGKLPTPFFMPVGTVGSVKSTAPWELEEMGAQILLSNTYHLYLRPGEQLVKELGGLHKFMGWNRPILTDSGGYQVFSLGENKSKVKSPKSKVIKENSHLNLKESLVKISEDGVEFKSFLDGSKHLFTPEKVIDIQLDLGVDILMPLDVCPSGKASAREVKEAVELTIRWAKRAREHFNKRIQNSELRIKPLLHGIVQGGLDPELRKYCAEELIKLDFDGYSVGGLAVDLETRDMWGIVKLMGEILPENKQRYLMGVGTPDNIIIATKLGMDMFDCVLPTRLARHASVFVKRHPEQSEGSHYQLVNLLNSKYRADGGVIDQKCGCRACQEGRGFSKAYISHLLRSNEILGLRLTTLHNLWQYLELMRNLRNSD